MAGVDVLEGYHLTGVSLMAPEVQIWRKSSQNESEDSYVKIDSIPLNTTIKNRSSVVELNLHPPIRVQEGDILGVYQPRYNESSLSIRYQVRDGPINYAVEQQNSTLSSMTLVNPFITNFGYPLVTMQIISGA